MTNKHTLSTMEKEMQQLSYSSIFLNEKSLSGQEALLCDLWQWLSTVDIQAVNSLMIKSTSNFCVDEHWRNKVTAELSVVRLLPVRTLTKRKECFWKTWQSYQGIWQFEGHICSVSQVYSRPKTIQKYELRKIVAFYTKQYMCIKYAAF